MNIHSICSLLLLLSFNSRAQYKAEGKPARTVIAGTFSSDSNRIGGKAVLWYKDETDFYYSSKDYMDSHPVTILGGKEAGTFNIQLNLSHPIYIMSNVFPCNYSEDMYVLGGILIEPGDSIYIDGAHAKNIILNGKPTTLSGIIGFEDVPVSGKGVEKLWCIQNILRCNKTLYDNVAPDVRDQVKIKTYSSSDSIRNMINQIISIYKHKISATALSIIKANFISKLAPDPSYIFLNSENYQNPLAKKTYVNFCNSYNVFDLKDSALRYTNRGFFNVLRQRFFLEYTMNNNLNYKNVAWGKFKKQYYDAMSKYFLNSPLRRIMLSQYLTFALKYSTYDLELTLAIKEFINETNMNDQLSDGLKRIYLNYQDNQTKGALAYPFSLLDTSGKVVNMMDFKGKVVLLDFMFNACPGCRHLVPFLEKVEANFKNRNDIAFIAISVDEDINIWKKGIGHSSVPGSIQLYTNGEGVNHPIIKHYQPQYPTLVLIDKAGKIVTTRAPDPRIDNGEALTKLLNESLN